MGVLGLLGLTRFEYKNHCYGGGFFMYKLLKHTRQFALYINQAKFAL